MQHIIFFESTWSYSRNVLYPEVRGHNLYNRFVVIYIKSTKEGSGFGDDGEKTSRGLIFYPGCIDNTILYCYCTS